MDEVEYLTWDTSSISERERDELLKAALDDMGAQAAVVEDEAELDAIRAAVEQRDRSGTSPDLGTQFGEVTQPELILITLESTLIAIESAKLFREVRSGWSGFFRRRLAQEGQESETATGNLEELLEQAEESIRAAKEDLNGAADG